MTPNSPAYGSKTIKGNAYSWNFSIVGESFMVQILQRISMLMTLYILFRYLDITSDTPPSVQQAWWAILKSFKFKQIHLQPSIDTIQHVIHKRDVSTYYDLSWHEHGSHGYGLDKLGREQEKTAMWLSNFSPKTVEVMGADCNSISSQKKKNMLVPRDAASTTTRHSVD